MLREADKGRSYTRKSYHESAGVCIDGLGPGDLDRKTIVNRSSIHLNLFPCRENDRSDFIVKAGIFCSILGN